MAKGKVTKNNTKNESADVRTPIVAVMGHVDHGKTSLLDAIRGTKVAESEHGGITQNTRAHQVTLENEKKITFIDTPGHEAFTAMRSRGAEVTDFVLLVVAADDGVQAQTKESIKFAKDTNTPVIVAINKIDINGVKTDKIKKELSSFGVNIEEYGGDSMCFEVSATKGTGVSDLLEGISLLAEVNELKPGQVPEPALAQAYVLESHLDKQLGAVALCILKSGSISEKLLGATRTTSFKIRAFLDQSQKQIDKVEESDPFWMTGLGKPLTTGETVYFVRTDKEVGVVQNNLVQSLAPEENIAPEVADPNNVLLQLLNQRAAVQEGQEQKVLPLVVRAATQGTLEAVKYELGKLGDDDKAIKIIDSGTGEVTEADIKRAKAAHGIIVSFQSPLSSSVERYAKQEKVIVRNYEIIYEMMDELTGALDGLIEPEAAEVEIARAKIKQVFELTDGSMVAGAEVIKGILLKGYSVYVERPSESTASEVAEVARGRIKALKILKNEVREVKKGQECGILIDPKPENIEEGDEVVAYKLEK